MGRQSLGIHSTHLSLEGGIPDAMETEWGAHEPIGIDRESTVSVRVGPDLSEMPSFSPKHGSRNVRQTVGFVAK